MAWLYDPVMKVVMLPFGGEKRLRSRFVDWANPESGEVVLDICSGTRTLASLIAARVGPSGAIQMIEASKACQGCRDGQGEALR